MKNRGELIDIARSYLCGDNHVICREDIPQMIDDMISCHTNKQMCDCSNPKSDGWCGDAYLCECGHPFIVH